MFKGIYVVGLKTIKREPYGESQTIQGKEMKSEPCRMPPCLPLSPPQVCWRLGRPPFLHTEADLCRGCPQLALW